MSTIDRTCRLGTSRYGNPLPTVDVRVDATAAGKHPRMLSAELHELAAAAHRATPEPERWCVNIDRRSDTLGTVSLELADGTPGEAARAMAVLRQIVEVAE